MVYTCSIDTPLGEVTVSAKGKWLTGLWFLGQNYYPKNVDSWIFSSEYFVFQKLRKWIYSYFSGEKTFTSIPINPEGSEFQKEVWKILMGISYGETITYGEIAKKIATKRGVKLVSSQAVGGAVGRNPLSIIIPCHRVVGANKKLVGYAGGIERKEKLLRLEREPKSLIM